MEETSRGKTLARRLIDHRFWSGIKHEHLVAGVSGGVVSTLLTHPFDLIKLRLAGEISTRHDLYFRECVI